MSHLSLLFTIVTFLTSVFNFPNATEKEIDLVKSNRWFIAGPAKESEEIINAVRIKNCIIKITAKDNPVGKIELNVAIIPSASNDGIAQNLSDNSKYVTITYKASHLIKLQAREGNEEGTGCEHGGLHPRVDLPPSVNKFTTLKIPWKSFRQNGLQNGLQNGKLLNIHNLCKFNFVNYNPVSGAFLEIKSIIVQI